MATKPTPKPKYKLPAKPSPRSGNDPVTKALKFFFGDQTKPSGKKKPGATKVTPNRKGLPGPKKKSPNVVITPKPKKKPTLDDFLLKGKRPPLAPGQKKLPNDYDVILKGYNDKKTINKYKKK